MSKQLDTLHKYEKEKENIAALSLKEAESDYQGNVQRINSVAEYRLEYMKRLSQRGLEGIDSATYSHFHKFIAKLDHAGERVEIALSQSKALVEQRRNQWMQQRQKVQAVELLKEKQDKKLQLIAARKEQVMFDEIATQQFVRRHAN